MTRGKRFFINSGSGHTVDPQSLYIYEGLTLDEIAARFKGCRGYSKRSLVRRSSAEKWKELRRLYLQKTHATAAENTNTGIDPVAQEVVADMASRMTQACELGVDTVLSALEDVQKLLRADKVRVVSEVDGERVVSEVRRTPALTLRIMRFYSAAVDSLLSLCALEKSLRRRP
jgi:hypothetical protein